MTTTETILCIIIFIETMTIVWPKSKQKEEKSEYSIEYFPITNRYYPKYKDKYIWYYSISGLYRTSDSMTSTDYFDNKEDALKYIEKFKELKDCKSQVINL